jgi:hypothetical protein
VNKVLTFWGVPEMHSKQPEALLCFWVKGSHEMFWSCQKTAQLSPSFSPWKSLSWVFLKWVESIVKNVWCFSDKESRAKMPQICCVQNKVLLQSGLVTWFTCSMKFVLIVLGNGQPMCSFLISGRMGKKKLKRVVKRCNLCNHLGHEAATCREASA